MNPPELSQYQGPMYIKQFEDVFLPPQPFSNKGFPHQGRELTPPNYRQLPVDMVLKEPIFNDFLPFRKDFNRYIYNPKSGYVDTHVAYPIYTTGFSSNSL